MAKSLFCITEKSPDLLCAEVNKLGVEPISIINGNGSRYAAFYLADKCAKKAAAEKQLADAAAAKEANRELRGKEAKEAAKAEAKEPKQKPIL